MENKKPTQFLMKPKVDFCFKELMEDEEVRNAFLAAVLGINLEEINESKILPSHLRQKDKDDKLGILDVRVLLNNREQIDIEIQVTFSEYWAERTLFYLGKMFTDQLKPGENYQKLEKCIHIGILNFIMFDDEEYYSRFHFWSDKGRKLYSDKFEIHTLELPKLAKHDYPETELLKWLQFINAETEEEFEMAAEKSEYIKKAYEDLNRISADEEKRLNMRRESVRFGITSIFPRVGHKNTGLKEGRRGGSTRRHTGCCGAASGNGTGKRSDLWKSSGKVSHFCTGGGTGSGKILEVGSMGDWGYFRSCNYVQELIGLL